MTQDVNIQKASCQKILLAKFIGQGISTSMAEFMAEQGTDVVWKIWGGKRVYFCRGRKRKVNKDLIWDEFNGRNHQALAEKHHCSVSWVEKIVAAKIAALHSEKS